ncbi:Rho termination factor domain protein [Leptolyngbya sp. NIES-3755]|nr:Rho termination factor domain protein [Leptolyngbya sp. NIES-3755]
MLPNQKSSALGVALLLTTVATTKPLESIFISSVSAQATPTTFPLPTSVPSGTTVQIDGSSSMAAINQALKQRFESQFSGSTITLNYSGTPTGLQSLQAGKIDLAAIGRPLTQAERNQGLVPVSMGRGKIALIVSPDNPFKGSITVPQFVRIVRGEITDWSELGGQPGKIRFVDRPDLSDTRAAFQNYSVFIQTPYQLGNTATRAGEDSTQAVAQQLGKDGLSFAPANQVLNSANLRIVPMHNTLPTDPRYPFSQPFYYVHRANPSPGAAAFLGYASSDSGQKTAEATETDPASLGLDPAVLLAAGSVAAGSLNAGAGAGSSPSPNATASPAAIASPNATVPGGATTPPEGSQAVAPNTSEGRNEGGIPGWLWWLLPLGIGALLLAWWLRRRSTPTAETPVTPPAPPTTVTPPPPPPLMTPTETDGSLASRAGSVISSDRQSIAEVQSPTIPPTAAIGGAALAGAGAASLINSGQTQPPVELEPPTAEVPPADLSQTTEIPPVEPPIAEESIPVPDRPLVEIRETPPIEVPTSQIEPPEAPPETDMPNGAILGAAGLGVAGAAAWMSRTRSGVPPQTDVPETEPLSSLDAIEPLDEVEDAPLDQPPVELYVDDSPTVVDELNPEVADPNYVQLNLDPQSPTSESSIVNPTNDSNFAQGVLPGIAVLGGTGLGAAISSEPEPSLESSSIVESSLEPTNVESEATNIESEVTNIESEVTNIESEVTNVEPEVTNIEPEVTNATSDETDVNQGVIPGLAALGGAALGIAGVAATGNGESAEPLETPTIDTSGSAISEPQLAEIDAGTDLETDEFASITAEEPDTISEEPPTILEIPDSEPPIVEAAIPGVAAVGGLGLAAAGLIGDRENTTQTNVEAARFDVGQTDLSSETLASVDEDLPDLPDGYGESRIVLMPRDPQWAYTYWDLPNEHKSELRTQGGQTLVLRLYDVTDINLEHQSPHSLQQFECDELARDWYVPIPVSDRDYLVEIGYLTGDGRWLMLARSLPVRIPPVYPSAWENDQFVTIDWDRELQGQTSFTLGSQTDSDLVATPNGMYDQILGLSQGAELQRIAGSIFGSMQQVPIQSISSYVFPSGVGMWALPTVSGMSGVGMSGVGLFSGGAVPIRPRKFWLVADAELIIYGATEPDATVTIAGETIPLSPDGTFRFQMSFQDGLIDYPILAVAKDGEQTRSIHLKFTRETPSRNTNTKDEAIDEWQS